MSFLKPPKYSNFFIQSNYIHHEYWRSRKLMGINFYYPYKLRPLSYGNESIGSACTHRATFSNTGLF